MSLKGLLNQTITIYPKSSYDGYGREVVGSGVSYRSRFQKKNTSVLLPNGQVIQLIATVYIAGEPSINVNDKVTYGSRDYKVYGIYTGTDGQGNTNHTRLDLIEWRAT